MSRSRERILGNLDEMYPKRSSAPRPPAMHSQMATLDFAYRREQLYFEILLDVREAIERRPECPARALPNIDPVFLRRCARARPRRAAARSRLAAIDSRAPR